MATVFKSTGFASVGTTPTTVYTAPALTTTTVVGLSVANRSMSSIQVDVELVKGGVGYYLIYRAPVGTGSALVVVGGDQKVVVEPGNFIRVTSTVAGSADVVTSVLELT